LAIRIFLNILVLKETPVDRVGNADEKTNGKSAPKDETAIRLPQPHTHLIVATVTEGVNEQIEGDES
jgi:hypothetical protein